MDDLERGRHIPVLRQRLCIAALAMGFLASGCTSDEITNGVVEKAKCVEAEDYTAEELDDLPGKEMRLDLNKDPLFRAATLNIAFDAGHGSGGLYRHPDGKLIIHTARHIVERLIATPRGGIFFPDVGWWDISGCDLEEKTMRKFGKSEFKKDSIAEVRIPDEISEVIETYIENGSIQPLESVRTDIPAFNLQELDSQNIVARIARADTGLYTELLVDVKSFKPGDSVLNLVPFTTRSGSAIYTGNVCAGRSGQPVHLYNVSRNETSPFSVGVVSYITEAGRDFIGLNPSICSPHVGVLTYTR